jgi:hypothetical protein
VKSSSFTWFAGLRCVLRYPKEGWEFGICLCPAKFFWGSGFSAMFMRERPYWRMIVDSKYDSAWGRWRSNESMERMG